MVIFSYSIRCHFDKMKLALGVLHRKTTINHEMCTNTVYKLQFRTGKAHKSVIEVEYIIKTGAQKSEKNYTFHKMFAVNESKVIIWIYIETIYENKNLISWFQTSLHKILHKKINNKNIKLRGKFKTQSPYLMTKSKAQTSSNERITTTIFLTWYRHYYM